MAKMELRGLSKEYNGVEVLSDINFDIEEGEFVVLIGESGCGKTTLLRMISGLEEISDGELIIDGKVANHISPQKRDMSMVFQSYALYPHMNVYDNIAYGLKMRKIPKKKMDQKVQEIAKLLGIDAYLDRLPKNLSGGQRQRVAMGRAIVRDPEFFLFDEPLSNLDAKLRVSMRKEIKLLQKHLGTTTIYVTHDQIEAMTMADKIVLMDKGRIVQVGTPKEIYDHPNSLFAATFLGSPGMSLIEGSIKIDGKSIVFLSYDGVEFPVSPGDRLTDGQKVILGIRPRDFHITTKQQGLKALVQIHEYTGAENIIYAMIGKSEIIAAFSRKEEFSGDDEMYLTYEVERAHIFDVDTHEAIR